MKKGNWTHENSVTGKDEWLTPPRIISALGSFDLDPCAPVNRPWSTAKAHFTILDDGLNQQWHGRVWCNPPYDSALPWIKKLSDHGNGIALLFARTETELWQKFIFPNASALLFVAGRIKFFHVGGIEAKNTAGAPSVLVAFGLENVELLRGSWPGKFLIL